jgi:hypothetical protein
MSELERGKNYEPQDEKRKTKFFNDFALGHMPEMRLLFRGGKLDKLTGWRNVAEHCLVEAVAADTLAESLALMPEERNKLVTVAACHDWAKKLDKRAGDFAPEEAAKANEFLAQAKPEAELMAATNFGFLDQAVVDKRSTFLQRLQFYIDEITSGSLIVDADARVDEAELRDTPEIKKQLAASRLGSNYRLQERRFCHEIEKEIFQRLKETGATIDSPAAIPGYIREKIDERVRNHSL